MDRVGEAMKGLGTTGARIEELLVACIGAVGVDGGGMSLASTSGVREPLYGSDRTAQALERLQFTLGEGPCVDASFHGSPVLVADLLDRQAGVAGRWPVFLSEASQAGVRAVFAFPVHIGAISLGAVDLYRSTPGGLGDDQLEHVLSVVDAIAMTMLDAGNTLEPGFALDPISMEVHRAAGMVMIQLDCSIEAALAQLRAAAFSEGRPVHELAGDVVAGMRRFREETR